MLLKSGVANEIHTPVAIFDKELLSAKSFRLQTTTNSALYAARDSESAITANVLKARGSLSNWKICQTKLTEILAKDHRQDRAHKHFIELDICI